MTLNGEVGVAVEAPPRLHRRCLARILTLRRTKMDDLPSRRSLHPARKSTLSTTRRKASTSLISNRHSSVKTMMTDIGEVSLLTWTSRTALKDHIPNHMNASMSILLPETEIVKIDSGRQTARRVVRSAAWMQIMMKERKDILAKTHNSDMWASLTWATKVHQGHTKERRILSRAKDEENRTTMSRVGTQ